jgi:gas vesicle protein
MEDDSRLGWFIAGAAIGATVALLYAPKTGRDTRKYLGKTTAHGVEAMEASGKDMMDRGKELYDRGKQIAEDAADLFERGRKLVQG